MTTLGDYVPDPLTLLTAADLKGITGLSRAQLQRLAKDGEMPTPFYVGPHAFWLETDIVEWLRSKHTSRTPEGTSSVALA